MPSPTGAMLALVALLCAIINTANGHAHLVYPPSRNHQAWVSKKFWCPWCGQGDFTNTKKPPNVCGDPFQNTNQDPAFRGWKFINKFYGTTTLKEGQTIKVQLYIDTNHGGRMQMAVCPLPANKATQACFNQHLMRRVSSNPQYNNKLYWYMQKSWKRGQYVTETFKLPAGVNCKDGCLIQWGWLGYQTCMQPCKSAKDDVVGECGKNIAITSYPVTCTDLNRIEVYYNCADVKIMPK